MNLLSATFVVALGSLALAPPEASVEGPEQAVVQAPAEPTLEPVELPPTSEPSPSQAVATERWIKRRRNLRIGLGCSIGLVAVGGVVVLSTTLHASITSGSEWAKVGAWFGALYSMPAWLPGIAGILGFGISLGLHAKNLPAELTLLRHRGHPRLSFDPTRMQLRF